MILEQRIQQTKLTDSEQAIAHYIIEHKYELESLSTRDIAKETFTSSSSVVRFSQKLNYEGFEDLKKDYMSELKYINEHFQDIDPNTPFQQNNTVYEISGIMSSLMSETADDTLSLINHEELQHTVALLSRAENIYVFATENNLFLAQSFKYKMLRIQKNVQIEQLYGNQIYTSLLLTPKDCAIVISYSGEGKNLLDSVHRLYDNHIPMIAITSLGDNSLKNLATHTLHISTREKLHSKIANYTTEYSISLILNILYSCYFARDYHHHMELRMHHAKNTEKLRSSKSTILNED